MQTKILRVSRFLTSAPRPLHSNRPICSQAAKTFAGPARAVAQVSNLLYHRFPIGRRSKTPGTWEHSHGSQAGSTAIQQVGNLRYSICGFAAPWGLTLPALALAGIWLLCGCERKATVPAGGGTPEVPMEVKMTHPVRGPITRNITLPGEVKAYQQATIYAKVAGYLKTISVDKGDSVNEGALIADLEAPELVADLARSKADLEVAELDYKRLSESQKSAPDLVVPQTVDNAKAKLDVAKATVERAETLLRYAKITAPFSGVITRRMADPGAFIPAATSGTSAQNAAIVTLADFSRVRVQTAVPEAEASLVGVGQPIRLMVEGLPGRSFEGAITRFSYALDEGSKTMLAEAELPNPKLELRPGMYASVQIGIERKVEALLVPVEALLTEKAGVSVFIVVNGKVKKTKVQTGFNDGVNVEIVKGLEPDQPVILIGKQTLNDGQPVKTVEAK